jgi:hypothetical protein
MTDTLGSGVMLFGPEHALQVAAEAIEATAKSPDMAVGIVYGIQATVREYARMISVPQSETPASAATAAPEPTMSEADTKVEPQPGNGARRRVAALSRG